MTNAQDVIAEKRISDIIFEIEMGTVSANEQQSHWQDSPPQGYMNMLQNEQVYRLTQNVKQRHISLQFFYFLFMLVYFPASTL